MRSLLVAVWGFRSFILASVRREVHSKYRGSILGALWLVLTPLAQILVYTIIFSHVMRARLPGSIEGQDQFAYSIYLCAGILTWGLFSEIVGRCHTVFLDNANLLKKLSFPRIALPVVVVLNACVNAAFLFALYLLFLAVTGNLPGAPLLALFPVLLVLILFALGLGVTLGVLNVFFRDIGPILGIVLQFWFWMTPIVYPVAVLPDTFKTLVKLNPLAPLVAAVQTIFVEQRWPDWVSLIPLTLASLVICGFGLLLFRRRSPEMVDEL